MEEGLIIMFVNVITKLCRCAAAGGSCPADPKDTAGCDKTVSGLERNGKFPAKILSRRIVNNKFTILLCS